MTPAWRAQAERGTASAVRLLIWIALRLGRPAARALLYPITAYFLLTARTARRASRLYLARVFGRPARWWHVARHIHTFSATILDRVFLLTGQRGVLEVRVTGAGHLAAPLAGGRGALLLGSHLGSFEVLRALAMTHLTRPVKILMHRGQNRRITDLLDALQPGIAATVIELGRADSMIRVQEALQDGALVGILGDRFADGRKFTRCTLLGSPVVLPTSPIVLAALLGVPILLFFGLYRGGNRYEVILEPFAEHLPPEAGRDPAQAQQWMQAYAARLEHYMRQAPYNWFNFFDYWEETGKPTRGSAAAPR